MLILKMLNYYIKKKINKHKKRIKMKFQLMNKIIKNKNKIMIKKNKPKNKQKNFMYLMVYK